MVRLLVSLLLAIAAGATVYLGGAVVWCLVDPQGAGVPLLFTIPIALLAAAIPALLGMLGLISTSMLRQPATRSLTVTAPVPTKPVARPINAMLDLKPIGSKPRKAGDPYRATFTPDHSLA